MRYRRLLVGVAHICFWCLSLFIFFRLFTSDYENGLIDYLHTFIFHLPLLFSFYASYYAAQLYIKGSGLARLLLMIFVVNGCGYLIHHLSFGYVADILFSEFYLASTYSSIEVLQFNALYTLFGILIFFTFSWFSLKERQLSLLEENNQIKIRELKNQMNPHFLMNSLNNIYSFIEPKNKPAQDYLMSLSDSLRYMLYDTEEDKVLLQKEIDYIENYITLESLRFENRSDIQVDKEGLMEGYVISPLLLIVLVENCFKHCNKESPKITISLALEENKLTMATENKVSEVNQSDTEHGIGLQNLRNRLQLIYPGKHILVTHSKSAMYYTTLTIDLS